MKTTSAFKQPTPQSVAQRIRSIRKSRGWTLHDIESRSSGSIKAVVMGSYERGTRAISLARALELANLFAIPIADLLGDFNQSYENLAHSQRFDQRRVSLMAQENEDSALNKLNSYLIAIAARRGDWNGEILTLRSSDLDTLTLLLEMNQSQLDQWLNKWQIAFS
jgi:transcriptional regulator with XRE-family HTH domain